MLAGLLFAAVPAYAQTVDTDLDADAPVVTTDDEDEFIEDTFDDADEDQVVVTGSRLRQNEFTSVSPLQVVDGELARDLGLVDAADLLGQTTVIQGQQTTTSLSTSAGVLTANGPGSANANLRGLGFDRTLVLVNGRRLAPAGVRGAPSAADINLIPGTLVERVDVLLDGASSIYGSDAIAGVVNYELQREFEGLEIDAFATVPTLRGNAGHRELVSAKAGLANEDGFFTVAVEHTRQDGFEESALSEFYEPYSYGCRGSVFQGGGSDGVSGGGTLDGTIYAPDRCTGAFGAGSASSPFGFLAYDLGAQVPGLPDNFAPIRITADLIQPDNVDGQRLLLYPEELDAAFTPDFQRTSLFAFGEYAPGWYGDATAYFEASYAERRTETNTAGQGSVRIPADYGPSSFGGGGATSLFFQSRFINDTNVAQARFIGGLKGDLPFIDTDFMSNWNYDFYGSYSRSSGQDSVNGVPYLPRLEQTLSNTRFDEATGEFVCDARSIPGVGQNVPCRPLNFFEPGFLFGGRFEDPEDTAYLFPNRLTDTVVTQSVFAGFLSGDLFNIPWGDTIQAGIGAEYREDAIETRTSLAGDFQGFFNDPGANGSRNLTEVFGEINIPLLADQPFAESLTLNAAARYTDENNFGDEVTYSLKALYAPNDWLSFRATYGTSYRAPDVGEQFGGNVTGFGDPGDPCRTPGFAVPFGDYDNDPNTPDTREYVPELDTRDPGLIQRCLNGGGPFGIPGTNPFNLGIRGLGTQNPVFFGAPTRVASGSNPNLEPETSTALSIGGTFDQPWLDDIDLRLAVTYFELDVDGQIDTLSAFTIVNRCYNSVGLDDPTCAFLTRAPRIEGVETSGEVEFVNAIQQNLGKQRSYGIDYNLEFGFDTDIGLDSPLDYRLIARATQALEGDEEQFVVDGVDINVSLGEYGSPEWRLNFTNIFSWEDFQFVFFSRYIDSQVENFLINDATDGTGRLAGQVDLDPTTSFFSRCVQTEGARNDSGIDGGFNCFQADSLDSYWSHNASIAYVQDDWVFRAGVQNVFNDAPPLTDNNDLGSLAGIGYDVFGRTYFVNLTKQF